MALVAFAVAGLAVDGTRAFLMRRTLQNAADSAALAGAGELDARAYYSSGGRAVVLSPGDAASVARGWISARGIDARAEVAADDGSVDVVMRVDIPTIFLGLVGIERVGIAVQATAEPVEGLVPGG
jgi:hypothetical protein